MENTRLVAILGSLAIVLTATPANAGFDEVCVEQAYGVPGPQPKTPEWWNPALTENQRETRWTGSTSIYDDGTAVPELGSSRMIWDKPSQKLFFQFDIDGDPSIDDEEDIVMLTVSDPTGTEPDLYIQFQPVYDCFPVSNCGGLGTSLSTSRIEYSQATVTTSVSWSPLSTTNPSTDWTVVDPWVEVESYTSGGNNVYHWTLKFALEIPVDAGTGEAWPDLRVYGNSVMYMPGITSGTAIEFPLLCEDPSTTSDDCIVYSPGNDPLPAGIPDESLPVWSHVTTGSLALCDGVEIIRQLVGSDYNPTVGVVPGTSVSYELPGSQIPKFSGALLRAGFHNDTASSLLGGDIAAEFRIANWGLQWSTWPNATWSLIDSAALVGTVTSGDYGGGFGQGGIETNTPWVPSTSGLPLINDHQCMHVKLDAPGGGVEFKRDSVYRNMNLVNASVFRRPVDIDMTDREPVEGEHNEILLLHTSRNMPSVAQCDESGQTLRGCANGGPLVLATGDEEPKPKPKGEIQPIELPQGGAMEMHEEPGSGFADPSAGGGVPAMDAEPILGGAKEKGATFAQLPTSLTYAFEDTGGTINLPGAPQTPVYKLFSAYGYYVQHDGLPSQGWEHYITAPGAEAIEESPGLYRLPIDVNKVATASETFRVIDGIHQECLAGLPSLDEFMPLEEEQALVAQLMADGLSGDLKNHRVTDDDFACAPPPWREPCELDSCKPHSPISYIEHSAYTGQWSEGVLAKLYPDGLVQALAAAADEDDVELDDEELADLPHGMQDACCAQASVDPEAGRRGALKLSAMMAMLLLLRRGRRRRRRRDQ